MLGIMIISCIIFSFSILVTMKAVYRTIGRRGLLAPIIIICSLSWGMWLFTIMAFLCKLFGD